MACKSTKHCRGCRNDFYNGNNSLGVKQCWSLAKAKVVTRYRIGWWTPPDAPGAFTKVRTYDCHHETGKFGFYKELPTFATKVRDETRPVRHSPAPRTEAL